MDPNLFSKIEIFAFHTRPSFSRLPLPPGHLQLVLRLTYGGSEWYGGYQIRPQADAFDLIKWGAYLRSLLYCTVEEAAEKLQRNADSWSAEQRSLLTSALAAGFVSRSQELKLVSGSSSAVLSSVSSGCGMRFWYIPQTSSLIAESDAYFSPV